MRISRKRFLSTKIATTFEMIGHVWSLSVSDDICVKISKDNLEKIEN